MANTIQIAITRHEIDAQHFQDTYTGLDTSGRSKVFMLGRSLVLDELESVLQTLPKGSRILDVGCGTGHLTNWMKQKGFEVCGVEPAENMYNYAVKNFPAIEIKKGISSNIPFTDNSFDLVVAFEVLRYLDKAENILSYKEFYRVLKPGGRFFVTQVNLFSADFYYFFHHSKALVYKALRKTHHHCNFTTAKRQENIAASLIFKDVFTVGRFAGSVRIFYKLGSTIGSGYYIIIKKLFGKQRFSSPLPKNMAGHLIVMGQK